MRKLVGRGGAEIEPWRPVYSLNGDAWAVYEVVERHGGTYAAVVEPGTGRCDDIRVEWLTAERPGPCLAGDGRPVEAGQGVYDGEGYAWEVSEVTYDGKSAVLRHGDVVEVLPLSELAHEEPDSWERLEADARKMSDDYWGCSDATHADCPQKAALGTWPHERFPGCLETCYGCRDAQQLDIVRRAKKLAGAD